MESLTKEIALYEKRKKNREYKAKQREAEKSKKKEVTITVDNESLRKRLVCKVRKERQRTKRIIESCERHDTSDAIQNDVSHKKQRNVLNNAIYRVNLGEHKLMQRRICNAQNMAFRRATQTDDQRILRNAQVARQVAFRRSHESIDETEQRREASARYMATARSFLNNDEVNQIRIKETQNRLLKSNLMAETTNQETLRLIPRISEFVEVIQSTRNAFKHLMKTKVTHNEIFTDEVKDSIRLTSSSTEKFSSVTFPMYDQCHQANVCVCCDRFICGTEELLWINKCLLLRQKQRLMIPDIKDGLKACYEVHDPDLKHLLLSPRARIRENDEYLCCSQCHRSLQNDMLDKLPPKFSIANNFAIGLLPDNLSSKINEITSPMLSPVRPYAYVLSYCGGAHKAISGSFSFFNQSPENLMGSLKFHSSITKTNNVYVVLCGNFTPAQKHIIKNRCLADVLHLKELYEWLRVNNPFFVKFLHFDECPSPVVIEDEDSRIEESEDPNVEEQVEIQYWFPNNGDPNSSNSVFHSQMEFIDALLKDKEPTLIYNSRNYVADYRITLPTLFPLHFPFGTGGIEEDRRNRVSVGECLKHFLRLSLPMFQRSDIILVICHMYLRSKSFQSAYLKCMSGSSLQGLSRGETLSKVTEADIMRIAKHSRNDMVQDRGTIASELFHSITACCKNLPHCDESAKEARAKLFSMWYSFGPPAVFFTISPGDECSFRIKLCVNLKMQLLPQLGMEDNEVIADILLRSKMRIDNPGVCAREYNSIMQIIMECLVGWDFTAKRQGKPGIFGKVLGWSDTTEEQAKFTLHSHVLLFISEFDTLVSLLWSKNEKVRDEAKKELERYMKKTMSSTYNLSEEDYIHKKPKSSVETCELPEVTLSNVCRVIPSSLSKANFHKMRHIRNCHVLRGIIGTCGCCGKQFTTNEIIWNAVRRWNDELNQQNTSFSFHKDTCFPLTKEQLDNVALRYMYDSEYLLRNPDKLWKKLLDTIILNRFNEHDYRHRRGCFKKSNECRFHYPRMLQDNYELIVDSTSDVSTWYSALGHGKNAECYPFSMETKRDIADVFLNTNNPVVSQIFGYNNNVAMGNRNCIYYVTLYSTKGNSEEEQFPFLKHCTAIAKRLRRLRQNEEALHELLTDDTNIQENVPQVDFKVGLGHVLSGILAHLSSKILSSTMAWHLVMHETRFKFSHEFSYIFISQFEAWLLGNDIHFRLRRNKNKENAWMDCNLMQYIYRPLDERFDSICVWEFVQQYEMKLQSSLSNSQRENMESDFEENFFFKFMDGYPGYNFACLEKLKYHKVPMIYYKEKIPDLELCKLHMEDEEIDDITREIRNDYATKMLILFYPFRQIHDFPEPNNRWKFFKESYEIGSLYWDSSRIMQNIQDVENTKKIIVKDDSVQEADSSNSFDNIIEDIEDEDHTTDRSNAHNDSSIENVDLIVEEIGIFNEELLGKDDICGTLRKSMNHDHILKDPVRDMRPALLDSSNECYSSSDDAIADDVLKEMSTNQKYDIVTVVLNCDRSLNIQEPTWKEMEDDNSFNFEVYPLAMKACITHYELDLKQESAFNVICSSFMLAHLDDPSLLKIYNMMELEKARKTLINRGGLNKLIMCLSGCGGSGKSFVLNACRAFCRQFCRAIGKPFNDSVFIVSATTNTAAAQIKGDTIHTIAGLRRKLSSVLKNWSINWILAKMLFIDEISMMDITDFLKLDKYLRNIMAQFNSDALNHPFGGLSIIFCGDFSQLNPVGKKDVIYDESKNPLWGTINRSISLTMGNWRFKDDLRWGEILRRMHHGNIRKSDIELINTRVVRKDFKLPTFDDLETGDVTYACYTNAERNLICENIFASILEKRHPKAEENFDIPQGTLIIKGNFMESKNNKEKSKSFHKIVHAKCGDDDVQCGNGQNIQRIDPCLKLFVGCPIMVSVNDFKKQGVVKGTTGKFRGVLLKQGKNPKVEIWNGYKVNTVEAADVEYIQCEFSKKKETDATRMFKVSMKTFEVTIKLPVNQGKDFIKLSKCKILQFPLNNDLATTGHKLQGMTKKIMIVSQFNYSCPNWIYVVLSRVTTLDGLYLLQPIKASYNPKPSKVLVQEWKRQREKELELLRFLQENGHLPSNVDIKDISEIYGLQQLEHVQEENLDRSPATPRKKHLTETTFASPLHSLHATNESFSQYHLWFRQNGLRIASELSYKNGNCLFDSVASFFDQWKNRGIDLRFSAISWAQKEVEKGSPWGIEMYRQFEDSKVDMDCYGKQNYIQYLVFMKDPRVFGTEFDVVLLCKYLQISIKVFTPADFKEENGFLSCDIRCVHGNENHRRINLWLHNLHYEPIV